ncbi:MAG: hypothetical protein AB8G22_02100 [Saprospiraceae bacterium]
MANLGYSQKKQHSYVSDRKFYEPADLIGYVFRPNMYEVPYHEKQIIGAGKYVFSITRNKVFIEGDNEISGVYSLNNIKPEVYGYKLLLMNAHNPAEQGHLKVILNDEREVDALIFRRSSEHREIIYFQAKKSVKVEQVENEYFTTGNNLVIEQTEDIWGTSFRPFFRTFQSGYKERIYPADSVKINFIRKIINPSEAFSEPNETVVKKVSLDDAFTPKGNKNKKIQHEEYVEVRSYVTYDSGYRGVKVWKYPIQKIQQQAEKIDQVGNRLLFYKVDIKKSDPLFIYVSANRAVEAIEIEGIIYSPRKN